MADRQFGEPVSAEFQKEASTAGRTSPRLNWDIQEETLRRIDKIEENSRRAEQHLGSLLLT